MIDPSRALRPRSSTWVRLGPWRTFGTLDGARELDPIPVERVLSALRPPHPGAPDA